MFDPSHSTADERHATLGRGEFLRQRFHRIRDFSRQIVAPLSAEDCAIQSMPDVSPTRWHLAHTTWFFETFILKQLPDYRCFDESFEFLFNSYYNTVGKQFPRERRGLISRPGLEQTLKYRERIDTCIDQILQADELPQELFDVLELGLQHEQQHQELMLTDIKHVLSCNPLHPVYHVGDASVSASSVYSESETWLKHDAALVDVGFAGDGFAFDNEGPRHKAYIHAHEMCSNLVTNGAFLEFVEAGGYRDPKYWLSMGWATVCEKAWQAPLYWIQEGQQWHEFTLAGTRPLDLSQPVCHVSFFEADAYARWKGARLPTEQEWEQHASGASGSAVFADRLLAENKTIHPEREERLPAAPAGIMGNVWQWTASQYLAYPGFEAVAGALGEYNGKFMCNQFVLRGGSCATSSSHIRPTYRNFFPPEARWQFSGIRLAR